MLMILTIHQLAIENQPTGSGSYDNKAWVSGQSKPASGALMCCLDCL